MGKKVFHGLLILLCFVLPVTAISKIGRGRKSLSLPYTLPDTDLLLSRLVLHRNEDAGRLGLIAKNTGKRYLSYISVKLETASGTFCFETNYLPPGESAVLWNESPMEKIPALFDISCEVSCTYSPFLSEGKVIVTENDEGIWVENVTKETIPTLWVYCAAYDAQRALYWDRTHITAISNLRPGERRYLPVKQDWEYPLRVIGCREN